MSDTEPRERRPGAGRSGGGRRPAQGRRRRFPIMIMLRNVVCFDGWVHGANGRLDPVHEWMDNVGGVVMMSSTATELSVNCQLRTK